MELWEDIKGFEEIYQISNNGAIFNKIKESPLKPFDNKGYDRVTLNYKGKISRKLVHVLVAEHFIEEKSYPEYEVNHKDLNKKNNDVDNLEWVTGQGNTDHYFLNKPEDKEVLRVKMSKIGKEYSVLGIEASKKPVIQKEVNTYKVLRMYGSARDAANATNSSYKHISACCHEKRKTHNGYIWEFVNKESATTIETLAEEKARME